MLCLPFKKRLETEPWLLFMASRRYGIWDRWMETLLSGETHFRVFIGARDVSRLGIMLDVGC